MERYNSEEECKRMGLHPVPDCPYPVHTPIPPPRQLDKLELGWVRVVYDTCKLQYDVDQIEHYRHPRVLHVAEFVCPKGHIATSRRVFTSVDDKPAEEERGESAE